MLRLNPNLHEWSIGFIIGQTHRKMLNVLTSRLKEHDMTPEQFSVLCRLHESDGISQKEIADRTVKDQPTTARILDCLIRKELVRKQTSETDRRSFLVYLTEQGRHKLQLLMPIERQTIEDIFSWMSESEIEAFRQTHLRLIAHLDTLLKP
ncbi:MarR family winged helix-turn-helix transcriptional regulator [Paenibacillus oleatilyticus]|uniref:MarR family winged helix-turn-helix transcriptional regulator n=1 Tax=Paenibacillus oleatilyticus TaxID=2594886 RepID=A0ABV4V320_9BACL